jgi:hypothetical protein
MLRFPRPLRSWTAMLLLLYWGGVHAAPAFAGLAPSRVSGLTSVTSVRDADLIAVQRALEHKIVAQKLRDYGVAPAEIQHRLASLSDAELHQLASATRGLPTGGDGVGTLIGILIIILLVIIILKLLNKEIIVK